MNKTATKLLLAPLAIATLALSACASQPQADKATAKPHAAKVSVTDCMTHANLTDVKFKGGDGGYRKWTGYADGDLVRVTQLESKSAAKKAVKAATEMQGAAGGRYMVIGALGSRLTIDPLADCLRKV
jgi:hypothetical protein